MENCITYEELLQQAIDWRTKININKVAKYWIPILDSFLWGILDNELVVIWAESWVWKSELAYSIALHNARKNKTLLFTLEGDIKEIALRDIQKRINKDNEVKTVDYRFNLDPKIKELEQKTFDNISEAVKKNLFIFDKKKIPTLKFLKEMIQKVKDEVDMIIIDHLHYINFETENENRETGEIMRELKTQTDIINKPIVMVSHLRKINSDADPDIRDLYWSSNIWKEATTIILICRLDKSNFENILPDYMINDNRFVGTKFLIKKSRIWLPLCNFELIYDRIKKEYVFGKLIEKESIATMNDRAF